MIATNIILSGLVAVAVTAQKLQDANYDDITLLPALDIHPFDIYTGLKYKAFAAINTGLGGKVLTGLDISSPPNCITTQIVSNTLHGTPSIVAANGGLFTPVQFHFGCALASVESAVGEATSCIVDVSGYDKAGVKTAEQRFEFAPNSELRSKMIKAVFRGDFIDVHKITVDAEGATSAVTAVLYDDFQYRIKRYSTEGEDEDEDEDEDEHEDEN